MTTMRATTTQLAAATWPPLAKHGIELAVGQPLLQPSSCAIRHVLCDVFHGSCFISAVDLAAVRSSSQKSGHCGRCTPLLPSPRSNSSSLQMIHVLRRARRAVPASSLQWISMSNSGHEPGPSFSSINSVHQAVVTFSSSNQWLMDPQAGKRPWTVFGCPPGFAGVGCGFGRYVGPYADAKVPAYAQKNSACGGDRSSSENCGIARHRAIVGVNLSVSGQSSALVSIGFSCNELTGVDCCRNDSLGNENVALPTIHGERKNRRGGIWICSTRGRLWDFLPFRALRTIHVAASSSSWDAAKPDHDCRSRVARGKLILGIETSCDETGAAVVSMDGEIIGEALASQAELHAQWGGVVPKLAQGAHEEAIETVVQQALSMGGRAGGRIDPSDLAAVAVTIGPGLSLCLKVGIRKARALAKQYRLPIIPIHHMEAHGLVARLVEKDLHFPFLTLLISGGHNLLLLAHSVGRYTQLGTSLDDAIGEAYDKTARLLGLELSRGGGPALEELAREGDPWSFNFPVPMRKFKNCNFSYAGIKTAVRLAINAACPNAESTPISTATPADRKIRADIAASFQRAAVFHLEERTRRAIQWARNIDPSVKCLVVAGGVAANQVVRQQLEAMVREESSKGGGGGGSMRVVFPPPRLCTDNGVMVAWAGVERYRLGLAEPPPPTTCSEDEHLDIRPRWPLGEVFAQGTQNVKSMKQVRNYTSLTALSNAAVSPSIQ